MLSNPPHQNLKISSFTDIFVSKRLVNISEYYLLTLQHLYRSINFQFKIFYIFQAIWINHAGGLLLSTSNKFNLTTQHRACFFGCLTRRQDPTPIFNRQLRILLAGKSTINFDHAEEPIIFFLDNSLFIIWLITQLIVGHPQPSRSSYFLR